MSFTYENLIEMSTQKGVRAAIEWAQRHYPKHPKKPDKPFLPDGFTAKDAWQFAKDMETWDAEIEGYEMELASYDKVWAEIDEAIVAMIKDEASLSDVPEQYRENVYWHAWGSGHPSGYYEVYLELCSLVEIFK